MSPLLSPPPRAALAEFPSTVLDPTTRLYRVHRREHDPWFYASAETSPGRFDLRAPRGTCYLALERVGAFLEAFQALLPSIPRAELDVRRISVMRVARVTRLADCTSELAARFGVTGEIHSAADRTRTREWAEAFASAGFDGILYVVRHDPRQRLRAVALFGPSGVPDVESTPSSSTRRIGERLIAEAARRFGVAVLPHPTP